MLILALYPNLLNVSLELKEQYPEIDTLSMGMSQDYKLAVKHGSNTVRIGRAIFE